MNGLGHKAEPEPEKRRAAVIGEYGWGLAPGSSVGARLQAARQYHQSALVLTQLTDVENEGNGALRYDRTLKKDISPEKTAPEIIQKVHDAGFTNYPGGETAP